jgi:hypothetical protein
MKSERSTFRQVEESTQQKVQTQKQGLEFQTVEELLRHDNEQNPVPPEIEDRLDRSIAAEPKPAKSWFKNLFGLRA